MTTRTCVLYRRRVTQMVRRRGVHFVRPESTRTDDAYLHGWCVAQNGEHSLFVQHEANMGYKNDDVVLALTESDAKWRVRVLYAKC